MGGRYRPEMTRAGLAPTHTVTAVDETGARREVRIAGERPLTLYVDKREIVTLMTLGAHPEALVLGYLRNQGFVEDLEEIVAVQVDWDVEAAVVVTRGGTRGWDERLARRTVTTGCGQGTVFGDLLARLRPVPEVTVRQSRIYALLERLAGHNEVYRSAGAVHGCALCRDDEILLFIEDVGRHNAVDAIAGHMWLEGIGGADKVFYTTGRLTSEMVIKVAQMGIPVLLSRSGITQMGLELARRTGVTLIGRAKGRHFLVYHGAERVILDAPPARARSA
ncbi:formate dehydrogenase accessory sulfurtransferase FdhD [Inmirania thermothiophila]|uniref:Sulfur carrier protein FdhD n=1 Tax=Inmirania thermothiophila TaxID=1750597 RepID=A0A3N1Y0I4_9GAMM|nr:formate dehydrogenase accessory sulfurtransferase FdhD [Inmirania thermothiophila]ROR32326.1 FdhD protein [Inmirania thermothiophila]